MRNRLSEQLAEQRSFLGSRVALLEWSSRGFEGIRNRKLLTGEQGFHTKDVHFTIRVLSVPFVTEGTEPLHGALGIVKDARLRQSKASPHGISAS